MRYSALKFVTSHASKMTLYNSVEKKSSCFDSSEYVKQIKKHSMFHYTEILSFFNDTSFHFSSQPEYDLGLIQ